MLHALRSRWFVLLAVSAWLAQLWAPIAHAAAMADRSAATGMWCGLESSALRAKLADLPAELRDALQGKTDRAEKSCAALCVAAGGALPTALLVFPNILAAHEVPQTSLRVVPAFRQALLPPARGPPLLS
jgi:hypothetical protein